jgi:hypothetical protein
MSDYDAGGEGSHCFQRPQEILPRKVVFLAVLS